MPLVNRSYWEQRIAEGGSTWSENRWLDLEHGIVARAVFRRLWPRDALAPFTSVHIGQQLTTRRRKVLDVGAGDARWSAWMAEEFDVDVFSMDAVPWPVSDDAWKWLEGYAIGDAEALDELGAVRRFAPDAVVFMNSLTCIADWQKALKSAARLVPSLVIVFDNLMYPVPPWAKAMKHRVAISWPEVENAMLLLGYVREEAVGGDVLHRKWFLHTPRFLHPLVAVISAAIDVTASRILPFHRCRHIGLVFRRARVV